MRKRNAPPGRTSIAQAGMVKPFGPHHCTRRPGPVQVLKTRRRGASKTRVMTSSRSVDFGAALSLVTMLPPFSFDVLQIVVQPIEALVPEAAIVLQPVARFLEGTGAEPAGAPLCLATPHDQAGALQHLQVLGHGGPAHVPPLRPPRHPP